MKEFPKFAKRAPACYAAILVTEHFVLVRCTTPMKLSYPFIDFPHVLRHKFLLLAAALRVEMVRGVYRKNFLFVFFHLHKDKKKKQIKNEKFCLFQCRICASQFLIFLSDVISFFACVRVLKYKQNYCYHKKKKQNYN